MYRNPEHCRTLLPAECTDGHLEERLSEVTNDMRKALESGYAVTVVTHEATLTTQEAADVLGVSRPTLVRLLEQGHIPYDQPGRHRRLRLKDVLEFQAAHHHGSADGEDAGAAAAAAEDDPAPVDHLSDPPVRDR